MRLNCRLAAVPIAKSKHRIGWETQMTLRVNTTSRQVTEAKATRSRSFHEVDRAAGSLGESPAGAAADIRLAPAVSAAEQRVLSLVSRAWTNKEIAAALGLSPATVKRHIEKILTKLGLRNRVELAIYSVTANTCPHLVNSECALRNFVTEKSPSV